MEKFIKDVQNITGMALTPKQVAAFTRYEQELLEWNTRFNLTAIRESEGVRTKHFLDSLSCLLAVRTSEPMRLIDVGTGAGFPGIPLRIVCPNIQLTLVESVGKKADFCQHIVNTLGITGVEIQRVRAEEVGANKQFREKFDWAVARAVANLPVLVEYLLPLVKVGGWMLAQKGESAPAEAQAAAKAIQLLGGKLTTLKPVILPGVVEERYLVVIKKISATPPQYPRR
ncbi:MAG: 16S rRNA (guanine(527)-N(7))-methyltransferase RsmG, partial [Anaerolineaceae bacterium]|nr:16S rRNA (guanine(527)-N(7))-methyltransferase RsmG [Anaerolineaceae bacterium]